MPDAVRFCDECKPADIQPDGIREHTYADRELHADLYGCPRWKFNVQPRAKRGNPFCKLCGALTQLIDHIVPASEAIRQAQASGKWPLDKWAGFFLMSNLQGLCRRCHKVKTDEDKAHQGPWPDVVAIEMTAPKKKWSF